MSECDKYKGKSESNIYTDIIKICHCHIKYHIITFYDRKNSKVIDIGSGRGHELQLLSDLNILEYIGIEPSESSFLSSINKVKKIKNINKDIKITILRGIGNKLWYNGDGALSDDSKSRMI